MTVSSCCRANVGHHDTGYFIEVWCSRCGRELADFEVIDKYDEVDGDGEDD